MQLPLDTVRHLAALQNYAKQFDFETKMAQKWHKNGHTKTAIG